MTDPTTRDRIWATALNQALIHEKFKVDDVLRHDFDDSQRRTVRRTLNAMTELGYLSHSPSTPYWKAGEKLIDLTRWDKS